MASYGELGNRGGHASSSGPPRADEWRADYFRAIPELEEIAAGRSKKVFEVAVMRASQLDAGRLDLELTSLLQEQFLKAFSLVQPRLLNACRPELSLLLEFLIFRFSVWKGRPTPGSTLMNLRYRDERQLGASEASGAIMGGGRTGVEGPGLSAWQRSWLGLCYVLGRYAWGRLEGIALACRWIDRPGDSAGAGAWRAMQRLELAYRLASLLNFLAFLRYGKYRSLLERAVGARLVYRRVSQPRALSFEYLNRQLVWHELSELLLFLLPLINVSKLKSLVTRRLPSVARPLEPAAGAGSSTSSAPSRCGVCGTTAITVPFEAVPCGHAFCYFCLRSQTEAARSGFECPVCGEVVSAMRRSRLPTV